MIDAKEFGEAPRPTARGRKVKASERPEVAALREARRKRDQEARAAKAKRHVAYWQARRDHAEARLKAVMDEYAEIQRKIEAEG